MKNIKRSNVIMFISNSIIVLALLYLVFEQEWGYFFVLSIFVIVLSVLEIASYLRKMANSEKKQEKTISFTVNVPVAKASDIDSLINQIEKSLQEEINKNTSLS
ncbi:hypothetical protein [Psychrobacillus sp. FJAT-21963]|uniref:hypothetical protein n=1 Tax=Psychrobacillus sp. FJAT-21963 TaxID=1712028 RepID=UPI0006F6D9A7|nr:hypothetical protein [Psychrobacillus sp. FJAT-21963]KQL37136.1 hypothetical protein AN959_03600 [Psychrobacillus sp. FJAT-21963]